MSLARSVARNTLMQVLGKVATVLIGVVTIGLLQRLLTVSGFGAYTTAMSYLGFASVVADFGLYVILARELNRPGADRERLLANTLGLRLATYAAVFVLALGALPLFSYSPSIVTAVIVGSLGFLGVAVTQLLVSVFQTALSMGRVVMAEVIGRLVLLAGVSILVAYTPSLTAVMVVVVLASLANCGALLISARRHVRLRLAYDAAVWRHLLKETAPIAVSVVLNLLYFRLDTVILSIYRPVEDVGLYGAAYKVLEILNAFPIMFVGLMIPLLTQALADPARFRRYYQWAFDALVLAAVPIVAGGWMLSKSVLVAIGGGAYAPAAPVLQLLLIAVAGLYLNALSGHTVTVIGKQRVMVWGYLTVAALGVALYLILIPRFGLMGAAVGTIATEWATAVIGFIMVCATQRFRPAFTAALKAFGAGAVMVVVLRLLPGASLWLEVPVGAIVYGALLLLLRAVPRELLQTVLRREPSAEALPPTP